MPTPVSPSGKVSHALDAGYIATMKRDGLGDMDKGRCIELLRGFRSVYSVTRNLMPCIAKHSSALGHARTPCPSILLTITTP